GRVLFRSRCGGGRDLGGRSHHCLHPCHLADGPARCGCRGGPVLGPGPWGIRCHHHLRRELPRYHPDDAPGRVHGHAARPGNRRRAQSFVAPGLPGGVGHLAGEVGERLMAPFLDAELRLSRGDFNLEVSLEAGRGEILALLGPNGAGKSSVLRALAGLVPLTTCLVLVDGSDVTTTPVEHRSVGTVFPDYLLAPHLSALDNVAFGPRCRGVSRTEAKKQAGALLEHMGLAEYTLARPRTLSGGQAQRVALARALATRPRLLLLDEPMAALDVGTRVDVRARLGHLLEGFEGATILVTHDPLDAMVLADRIAVIESGRVVQQGTPTEMARRPRTSYVARLVG